MDNNDIVKKIRSHNESISDLLDQLEYGKKVSANPYESSLAEYDDKYALTLEEIDTAIPELDCRHLDLRMDDYEDFLEQYLPWHETIAKTKQHKKKIELFISFFLLGGRVFRSYLDAAGGGFSYAGTIDAKRSVMQDMEIRDSVRNRIGPNVTYVESSLSKIPLEDESMDAISTHHSFEHFQGTADMDFIVEAQRILKKNGMMVLVPLFLSRHYVEMTNHKDFDNWSTTEEFRLFDPKATLPGKKSGHFARIYDPKTFHNRIMSKIDLSAFSVELVEITLEGISVPSREVYSKYNISNFNYPYRALVLKKH